MINPTQADLRLLRVIVDLADANNGKPPTLAEIARALGLQSSSRAGIQRQLTKMRPDYVDWTEQRGSLQVTPAGKALLGVAPTVNAESFEQPAPDEIVPLLASGLLSMVSTVKEGRPLQPPYPPAWQRGMNMLAVSCIQQGEEPPADAMDVVRLCHEPLSNWPVRFGGPLRLPMSIPLLEDEEPTSLCRELAHTKGDPELEEMEKRMLRVVVEASRHRAQGAYVAFRSFVIEYPVVYQDELLEASFEDRFRPVGGELHSMYQEVPSSAVTDGKVQLCGYCGWTLEERDGLLHCDDQRCAVLTANFTKGTRTIDFRPGMQRVYRAIRRYVVIPGKHELETAEAIRRMGLTCEMWPGFDKYDLGIDFPNGETWAVDVKDWGYSYRLAQRLEPIDPLPGKPWSRAIYAIPDARIKESRDYLTLLRNRSNVENTEIMPISELLDNVRARSAEVANG